MFGPETEAVCRDMIGLRYRLLPYIYSMAREACVSGLPLARPLAMMYPGDARFVDESSSYLWGDALLVAPVLRPGATSREVEFPEGEWVDFRTDAIIPGGASRDVPAPLGTIPLFVRRGSIIPMAEAMDYTDERPADTLTLRVYPSPRDTASSTLYEDDGITTGYLSGSFALTRFVARVARGGNDERLVLTVGNAAGSFPGKLARRTYLVEIHTVAALPPAVTVDGAILTPVPVGAPGAVPAGGYTYDSRTSILAFAVTSTCCFVWPTLRTTLIVTLLLTSSRTPDWT